MQALNFIKVETRRYEKLSLWIIATITLVGLIAMNVFGLFSLLIPFIISALYSIVITFAYSKAWKAVAKTSPNSLTKFYLAASAFRMFFSAFVILVFCIISRQRDAILEFVTVFIIFYIILLIFDCVFFAWLEKRNKK